MGSVRHILDTPVYRLLSAPKPAGDTADRGYRQREAVVTAAYHARRPLLLGWQRTAADGPVAVYVGGAALRGSTGVAEPGAPEGATLLRIPPGGRGVPCAGEEVVDALRQTASWRRIDAVVDTLARVADAHLPAAAPSFEDCLLAVWHRPFAWLVVADPVPAEAIEPEVGAVAERERDLWRKAAQSPEAAVAADRLKHRHRELADGPVKGLWRIHLLAGAECPEDAAQVAALVCASVDLKDLPYTLLPSADMEPFDTALGAPDGRSGAFLGGSAALAALARPPEREVPGIRLVVPPEFDTTPEHTGDAAVTLGRVLDRNRQPVGPFTLSRDSLNRHVFVCGATGAGKSQTTRALLEAATSQGIPWLVVEPAKAEYRTMAARLGPRADVIVIRPGADYLPPAGINPLEPAAGPGGKRFPLQTHADMLRALFLASFESEEPFPQVLGAALNRTYTELGWDLALGEPTTRGAAPRYPTLTDLQHTAATVVENIGYSREITDNVRGFVAVRLSSLRLGTPGRFFENGHPIDFGELLTRNVVLEIEDVGDDRDKAFLMGTVLIRLIEHLRLVKQHPGGERVGLAHLSVFEEAHRLLRRTEGGGATAHAVEMFAGLLAEIRAYGEGLVIAEQIPGKLVPDVVKNTAVKIVHRLPAHDDRQAVGATMNVTDRQSGFIVTLPPGQAVVFSDGMDHPVLVQIEDGTAREAAEPPEPASVEPVIGRRSAACAPSCLRLPCTFREIRTAERALGTDTTLTLWAELAVVAHLVGVETPLPQPDVLERWVGMGERLLFCSLAQGVDAAIASRSMVLADLVSPAEFSVHVTDALRNTVATGLAHSGEEPQWLARHCRWYLVLDALTEVHRREPHAGRHPRSDEWAAVYGKSIPGDGIRAQVEIVRSWVMAAHRDKRLLWAAAFGVDAVPALFTAVGTKLSSPEWVERLAEELQWFVDCTWPLRELEPQEKG
ncbi:DNA helicase HerA-like ATPase [Saccharothrix tamanrassetensis]|uniref:DNA helicase HerA-like ATPase n=1 Tax=Saccharothrix tamanrassetensis TaxID=1051531 RepID=A0A841CV88_9PSEU|nr:ATP-binding protein [Saccharothrix tamanrassetensis]MBB5960743.1 DNA helicase HerA-like ATPase [Saccharothrix tamanrassetensis]